MRTSSSISRSSAGPLLVLALAAVLSAAFSWHAKRHWQVESAYWGAAHHLSQRHAEHLAAARSSRYVVFGGSTVRTSYIPSVLENEFGVPIANFGLHAGYGPNLLAELAFRETRPGDTFVIALEPSFLARERAAPATSGGIDFFLWENGLDFHAGTFFTLSPFRLPGCFRGNTRYNLFMIMKRIRGMKPYRYTVEENLHDDGWMEVFERRPLLFDPTPRPATPLRLGAAGREYLLRIRDECERRGCRAVYALPPRLEGNPNAPAAYATLLLDILPILPVVRDPLLGCNPNPDEFADTTQHPLRSGALCATRSLGPALAAGTFWTAGELAGRCPNPPSVIDSYPSQP